MKQICDTSELCKALLDAGILQNTFAIFGEDQKQPDGTFLHACEIQILTEDSAIQNQIIQIFEQQKARDWKAWRVATEQIQAIEQKSGLSRRDRDINMKLFPATDPQFIKAKAVEDQIAALRPELKKVKSL